MNKNETYDLLLFLKQRLQFLGNSQWWVTFQKLAYGKNQTKLHSKHLEIPFFFFFFLLKTCPCLICEINTQISTVALCQQSLTGGVQDQWLPDQSQVQLYLSMLANQYLTLCKVISNYLIFEQLQGLRQLVIRSFHHPLATSQKPGPEPLTA